MIPFILFLVLIFVLKSIHDYEPLTEVQKDFISKLNTALTNKDYKLTVNTLISVRHVEGLVHSVEAQFNIDGQRILYKHSMFFNLDADTYVNFSSIASKNLANKYFYKLMQDEGHVCPSGYQTIYSGL